MKKFLIIFVFLFAFIGLHEVNAGFGISPPYVKSDKLVPGSHYEQRIMLLRSSADEDLVAEAIISAPEIESWITIDKGNVFDLPKGEVQVPMVVKIDVPQNAELDTYKGFINVRIAPKDGVTGSGVAIALGARIDIDLLVSNQAFPDFVLRKISVFNLEELTSPWKYKIFSWFLYKLKIALKIENVGNVDTAPSRIEVEFYDITNTKLLGKGEDASIEKIRPFETKEVFADIPINLSKGQYWAKIKVFKDKDILYSEEKTFTIFSPGEGENVPPLGMRPYYLLGAYILLAVAVLLGLLKVRAWKPFVLAFYFIIIKPIIIIIKRASKKISDFKIKFWKWINKKSEKYKNYDN